MTRRLVVAMRSVYDSFDHDAKGLRIFCDHGEIVADALWWWWMMEREPEENEIPSPHESDASFFITCFSKAMVISGAMDDLARLTHDFEDVSHTAWGVVNARESLREFIGD